MVEQDEVHTDHIYIEPPDAAVLTDEDSGDEADHLSGNQLRAEAHVSCLQESDESSYYEFDCDSLSNVEKSLNWCAKVDNKTTAPIFPEPSFQKYRDFSPVELFELFFDDELIEHICAETRRYIMQKNNPTLFFTKYEIKTYIGIMILSGYSSVPNRRMYWENQADSRHTLVYESMRRNRFESLMTHIHFADNDKIDFNDKLYKLRPLINSLNKKFGDHFVPEQHLSYDESMIRYFGSHGIKQFIANKPIRFGYKCWSLNSSNGYLLSFEVYQGKSVSSDRQQYEKCFGKSTAPLFSFLDLLPDNKRLLPYLIYFDNLFTSLKTLVELSNRGYGGTGTWRENRIPKSCPISSKASLSNSDRGAMSFASDATTNVVIAHWKDNKVVTVGSNCHSVYPTGECRRFCR
ncbi:MAG: hypothetical protein AAGK05_08885, partial [Pseudomonadota bacterium]